MNFYYGVGDTYGDFVSNGMQKKVHLEFWMPFLGALGHYKIGDTYDTSHDGLKTTQKKVLLAILDSFIEDDPRDSKAKKLYAIIEKKGSKLNMSELNSLMTYFEQKGLRAETLGWPYDWSTTIDKKAVWQQGESDYPHIEFKFNQNGLGTSFSSYNYGSNIMSHILIDFIGYYVPRWVYGVHD